MALPLEPFCQPDSTEACRWSLGEEPDPGTVLFRRPLVDHPWRVLRPDEGDARHEDNVAGVYLGTGRVMTAGSVREDRLVWKGEAPPGFFERARINVVRVPVAASATAAPQLIPSPEGAAMSAAQSPTHNLAAYPTDLGDSVKVVIDRLRGVEGETTADLIHAGWHVAGYALGQARAQVVSSGPDGAMASEAPGPRDEEDLADTLEMALGEQRRAGPNAQRALASSVPWRPVALMLLDLLSQWLRGEGP